MPFLVPISTVLILPPKTKDFNLQLNNFKWKDQSIVRKEYKAMIFIAKNTFFLTEFYISQIGASYNSVSHVKISRKELARNNYESGKKRAFP